MIAQAPPPPHPAPAPLLERAYLIDSMDSMGQHDRGKRITSVYLRELITDVHYRHSLRFPYYLSQAVIKVNWEPPGDGSNLCSCSIDVHLMEASDIPAAGKCLIFHVTKGNINRYYWHACFTAMAAGDGVWGAVCRILCVHRSISLMSVYLPHHKCEI